MLNWCKQIWSCLTWRVYFLIFIQIFEDFGSSQVSLYKWVSRLFYNFLAFFNKRSFQLSHIIWCKCLPSIIDSSKIITWFILMFIKCSDTSSSLGFFNYRSFRLIRCVKDTHTMSIFNWFIITTRSVLIKLHILIGLAHCSFSKWTYHIIRIPRSDDHALWWFW